MNLTKGSKGVVLFFNFKRGEHLATLRGIIIHDSWPSDASSKETNGSCSLCGQ